jgi:hypothetical protein
VLRESLVSFKKKVSHKLFDFSVRKALNLSAMQREVKEHMELCILSMLCKRDFYQYIVSIYSLCQFVSPEKIVVVNDGSLELWHINMLREKIPDIEILDGKDYVDERMPTYTSWRRLLAIESLVQNYYVIQLDADLFIRNNIDEVLAAYKSNISFILGTSESDLISLEDAQQRAENRSSDSQHVQHLAELNMPVLRQLGLDSYIRGCAGFTGFAKGSFNKEQLADISRCMFEVIGDSWRIWGSEQVCTNLLIANQTSPQVLPLKYYDSVERYAVSLKLIHFIGPIRFKGFIYNRLAAGFVKQQLAKTNSEKS